MANCQLCGRLLDNPKDLESKNCGGDCLRCMADCDDPQAKQKLDKISKRKNKNIKGGIV
jgi:hypothetical protein